MIQGALVTDATGLLRSCIVERLQAEGAQVRGLHKRVLRTGRESQLEAAVTSTRRGGEWTAPDNTDVGSRRRIQRRGVGHSTRDRSLLGSERLDRSSQDHSGDEVEPTGACSQRNLFPSETPALVKIHCAAAELRLTPAIRCFTCGERPHEEGNGDSGQRPACSLESTPGACARGTAVLA